MSFRSIKITFLIAILLLSFSCGKDKEQEVKDAILSADVYLSTMQCQPAIDLLESIGRQNRNARYLKALSSAYACRAGYSTVVLFGTDIEKTATPSPLGGMATYSTSQVTATSPLTDDLKFRDLQTAIEILLYAGGIPSTTEPTAAMRAIYFSTNQAGDINTQIAFMMMAQMGKFMKVYANTDATGVKGAGPGGNVCFSNYPLIDTGAGTIGDILANQSGNCTVQASSHPQLNSGLVSPAERRKRLCEGIILVNGIIDLLPTIILTAGGSNLGDIGDVLEDITTLRGAAEALYPSIATVMNVLSQSNCETDPAITVKTIESYYASIFEAIIE